jgi:murein DD-endopeptidase MepM/ murein hydrolase activator NlpD
VRQALCALLALTLGIGLPAGASAASPTPTKSRGGSARAAVPAPPRSAPPMAGVAHVVREGDTLWNISRRYGVDVDDLMRANRLRSGEPIRLGRRLQIPSGVIDEDRQEPPSLAAITLTPPPEARGAALMWPVEGPVGSPFGPRGASWHGGVDIRVERGTPIRAAAPGMVVMSGRERAYGNVIKIWHAGELMTVYAHNLENHVKVGDWVERGQVIGTVGSTGRATAPHLHLEVRLEGRKYDPLFWLPEPGVIGVARLGAGSWPATR